MDDFLKMLGAFLTGVLSLAILSVIFSRQSQTASVIQAGGAFVTNAIAAAVSPVTGSAPTPNTSYGGAAQGAANLLQGLQGFSGSGAGPSSGISLGANPSLH